MSEAVRTLIVAEDPLARAGLAAMLAQTAGAIVVGQADEESASAAVHTLAHVEAVLWDLGWTPDSHLAAFIRFIETHATPVVALVADPALAGAVRTAGVRGLLRRSASAEQLATALQAVIHALIVVDESLPAGLSTTTPLSTTALVEPLTARELEVLRLLAEGLSNKEIAHVLGVSDHTAKFHVNAILAKLGAQSRTEAVVKAMRAGLILL
ncbi:MAG: response regulator transcription factor [Caldilinea sp.]|nr:response regulator transcription factor [Caldilinea sp.]MDW8441532.1 response regulator transcription factor [Caldilineaceae bacterium]